MFSDTPPEMHLVEGNNISLIISSKNIDEIKPLFNQLKEDGTVIMEIQKTFRSKCYGFVTDNFGIKWQLSYDNGQTGM